MTTYLITGGSGLVGNYIVHELVNRGVPRDDIVVYDLYPNEDVLSAVLNDITLIKGDVTDPVQLMETFREHQPSRVVHLAALVAHKSLELPTEAIRVNGLGTNNVFEAARIFDVGTCVFASSSAVYGTLEDYYWKDEPVFVDEEDPVKPPNPYAVTKYLNEVMGGVFNQRYDTNFVGVRIGGVWGRGRSVGATGELNNFVKEAGLGGDVVIPPYWSMWDKVNVSYGKDVGRWFVDLADRDEFSYSIYNQGNRDAYSFDRIVATLRDVVPDVHIDPPADSALAEWDDSMVNPQLDCRRWYDELGFEQRWTVEDAVIDYINHHREKHGLDPVST